MSEIIQQNETIASIQHYLDGELDDIESSIYHDLLKWSYTKYNKSNLKLLIDETRNLINEEEIGKANQKIKKLNVLKEKIKEIWVIQFNSTNFDYNIFIKEEIKEIIKIINNWNIEKANTQIQKLKSKIDSKRKIFWLKNQIEQMKGDWIIDKKELLTFNEIINDNEVKENLSKELYGTFKKTIEVTLNEMLKWGLVIENKDWWTEILKEYWYKLPENFISWSLTIKNWKELKEENFITSKYDNDKVDYNIFSKELFKKINIELKKQNIDIINTKTDMWDMLIMVSEWVIVWAIAWWVIWALSPWIVTWTIMAIPWIIWWPAGVMLAVSTWIKYQIMATPLVPYLATIWAIAWWIAWWVYQFKNYEKIKLLNFKKMDVKQLDYLNKIMAKEINYK